MAQVELADLTTWIQQGSNTPFIDAQTLEARLAGVASLLFPDHVCNAVGLSVLEDAVPKGLLGPPEAARHILCNSQLFSEGDAEHSECEPRGDPSLSRVEDSQSHPAHHPRSVWIDMSRRFDKALFDSSNVTRLSLMLAAAARVVFSWLPSVPRGVEFVTFYVLLLAVCANRCAVKHSLRSSFGMSLTNGILHLVLVVCSQLLLPLPVSFSLSSLTHVAALGVMMTSYVEPYFFRFVSQSVALSLVLLDGFMTSGDKDNPEAMCPTERSFSSSTALTLVLCLILSSFMSETVQYTKRKSYSGK